MNIFAKLFTKTKYNYVPPCPRCNNPKTGYVINNKDVINLNLERQKLDKLLNGEIVEIHSFMDSENILFCSNCGLEWNGIPEIKYLTDEEIDEEKKKRGIDDDFIMERNFTMKGLIYLKRRMHQEEKRKKRQIKKQKTSSIPNVKVKAESTSQPVTTNTNNNLKILAEKDLILMPGPKFKSFKFK